MPLRIYARKHKWRTLNAAYKAQDKKDGKVSTQYSAHKNEQPDLGEISKQKIDCRRQSTQTARAIHEEKSIS